MKSATVHVTVDAETPEAYQSALEQLIAVDKPDNFAIEFTGPTTYFLPIPHLWRIGANQLFACAARYRQLHPLIAHYAETVISEHATYTNIPGGHPMMPGGFAVYALAMEGADYEQLVLDYLCLSFGEGPANPQVDQEYFIRAYIQKFGFTRRTYLYFFTALLQINHIHDPRWPQLLINPSSLHDLVTLIGEHPGELSFITSRGLRFLFGDTIRDNPNTLINKAPPHLHPSLKIIIAHYQEGKRHDQ
ncbi:MAG: DUF6138 family protein [Corynebacterium sp.]|uniref:DUF6138 family protein n=1 Tax=Corynebacterium sp. TaxID=1720 RepID=UPI0026DB0D4E|nr:DUF6138 family protein [Corynebacterium sp.]MDO5099034.1 DUF6138 family protein [Corynebacterium sp.]